MYIFITAGPLFNVRLKFEVFHLEASQSCRYDFVEIRDGPYGFSPLLYKGCGKYILLLYCKVTS